jgi:hypothetical protein
MPARSTSDIDASMRKVMPSSYIDEDAVLLGGIVAALDTVETASDDIYTQGLWGQSRAPWVDLHAEGRGLSRGAGETDASLGARLSRYDSKVTPVAVLDGMLAVMAEVSVTPGFVVVLEHWKDGLFADNGYMDQGPEYGPSRILDYPDAITVVVEDIYGDPLDVRYEAWVFAVEDLRPHGCRAYVVVDA